MNESTYPEWEIEEAIIRNPSFLEIPEFEDSLKLIDRQRYLRSGKRLDLLYKYGNDKYLIIELKGIFIKKEDNVSGQINNYQIELSKELHIKPENIMKLVATPKGAEPSVIENLKKNGIIYLQLDEKLLSSYFPKTGEKIQFNVKLKEKTALTLKILQKRLYKNIDEIFEELLSKSNNKIFKEFTSANKWIKDNIHDSYEMEKIGKLFLELSKKSPIMAHEVDGGSNGRLEKNIDYWFWLFYSVMDRRANASLFIKARNALEVEDFFLPEVIIDYAINHDEISTTNKILEIMKNNSYTPVSDSNLGEIAVPKSIFDSAKLLSNFDYDFNKMHENIYKISQEENKNLFDVAWDLFSQNIYGVGPRITGQIIRGFVLKGNWHLPLNNDRLLEVNKYNFEFAGKRRFGLINEEKKFVEELSNFSDKYLKGNRAVISHILWYIRKKYCWKVPRCDDCPLSGYCFYYLKNEFLQQRKICDKKISCEECNLKGTCGYF